MTYQSLTHIIDLTIGREGGYSNHPADTGGATRWGVTERVARRHGYKGDMRSYPRELAVEVYLADYVRAPGIDLLFKRSPALAAEAFDTGVNMGAPVGVQFLQEALNLLNGDDWPDLAKIDGDYGPASDRALAACQKRRANEEWEDVLLAAMNVLQGERYADIARRKRSQEAFTWGWFRHRIAHPA